MKCVFSLLFILSAVQLMQGALLYEKPGHIRRFARSTKEELFTCVTAKHQAIIEESWVRMMETTHTIRQNMTDCIIANDVTEENPSIRTLCESIRVKAMFMHYSEHFFTNIGAESIATDPVDVKSFAAATIQLVDLDDAEKAAALEDFDYCMAANYSLPYSFFSFRGDKIPDILRKSLSIFNRRFNFGNLPPTPSILAIDCLFTTLFQNGCATTSEEIVHKIFERFENSDGDATLFGCLDTDTMWFEGLCTEISYQSLENHWIQNCTKGSLDDSDCQLNRMRQLREAHIDCLMQFSKSKDYATYFKESRISRSNLSTEKKAAAMVSFDECLAVDFTPPHHIFAFELEKIQGPAVLQDLISTAERVYSIGNLTPSTQLRILDCSYSALFINGCDATTPAEIIARAVEDLPNLYRFLGEKS